MRVFELLVPMVVLLKKIRLCYGNNYTKMPVEIQGVSNLLGRGVAIEAILQGLGDVI